MQVTGTLVMWMRLCDSKAHLSLDFAASLITAQSPECLLICKEPFIKALEPGIGANTFY